MEALRLDDVRVRGLFPIHDVWLINTDKLRMMKKLILLWLTLLPLAAMGQKVAVKTNLLYDALLTPTVGVEVGLAPKWTVEANASLNAWAVNDHRWKQWMVQPEVRYWFCQRFSGHFVGAHLIGGQYNFGNIDADFKFLGTDFSVLKDKRYQGWMAGVGVAYGYSWILSRHWNFEAEVGLGWIYTRSDVYRCADCGRRLETGVPHNYVGLTKVALSFVYVF